MRRRSFLLRFPSNRKDTLRSSNDYLRVDFFRISFLPFNRPDEPHIVYRNRRAQTRFRSFFHPYVKFFNATRCWPETVLRELKFFTSVLPSTFSNFYQTRGKQFAREYLSSAPRGRHDHHERWFSLSARKFFHCFRITSRSERRIRDSSNEITCNLLFSHRWIVAREQSCQRRPENFETHLLDDVFIRCIYMQIRERQLLRRAKVAQINWVVREPQTQFPCVLLAAGDANIQQTRRSTW